MELNEHNRLGSCGGLIHVPVGTVVVPKACISVTRNVDFDFVNPEENDDVPYKISKPVCCPCSLILSGN